MKFKIILCLLTLLISLSFSQEAWEKYHQFPSDERWKTFTDHTQMLKACAIPEEKIHQIPTDILIEICIHYSLTVDIIAYNTFEEGFDAFIRNFNGANELLNRKDAVKHLVKKYSDIQIEKMTKEDALVWSKEGSNGLRLWMLEMFLSREEILSKINNNEVPKTIIDKIEKRINSGLYLPLCKESATMFLKNYINSKDSLHQIVSTSRPQLPKDMKYAIHLDSSSVNETSVNKSSSEINKDVKLMASDDTSKGTINMSNNTTSKGLNSMASDDSSHLEKMPVNDVKLMSQDEFIKSLIKTAREIN